MRTVRTLTLSKETLTDLTPGELERVVGGETAACPTAYCTPTLHLPCFSRLVYPCVTGSDCT